MRLLEDKTVVVTRPKNQAGELKFELENFGATVVLFPTIEIIAPESYVQLDFAINNLDCYDWLILTSANAAEHFLNRLEANHLETAELDSVRVCAIGEATFEKLRLAQVHVDVLPNDQRAEGVFAALAEYAGGENQLKNTRFLLPRSTLGREILPEKLRAVGALVDDVTAYQTVLPQKTETGKIKALLHGGAIDCIAFSSPSTFKNFLTILQNEDLPALLKNVTLAAIGETTAQVVGENDFKVGVVSPAPNAAAFAKAIADELGRLNANQANKYSDRNKVT